MRTWQKPGGIFDWIIFASSDANSARQRRAEYVGDGVFDVPFSEPEIDEGIEALADERRDAHDEQQRADDVQRRDANGRPLPPRRFYTTPTTIAKASTNIIHRPSYYKMHVVSGEWTYRWQTSESSNHEFSPLTVKYQFMNSHTAEFD